MLTLWPYGCGFWLNKCIFVLVCLVYLQQIVSRPVSKDEHQYDDQHKYEYGNNNGYDVTAHHEIRYNSNDNNNNIKYNTSEIKYTQETQFTRPPSTTTTSTTTDTPTKKEKQKERNGFPVEELLMY